MNLCVAGNCTQNVHAILLGRCQARGRNGRKAYVDLGDDRKINSDSKQDKFFFKFFIAITLIYNIIQASYSTILPLQLLTTKSLVSICHCTAHPYTRPHPLCNRYSLFLIYYPLVCSFIFSFPLLAFLFHRWLKSHGTCLSPSDISLGITTQVSSMLLQMARFHPLYSGVIFHPTRIYTFTLPTTHTVYLCFHWWPPSLFPYLHYCR